MKNFEYNNIRFSKEPLLYTLKPEREIHVSTFNEHLILRLSKTINLGQFTILVNALKGFMPDFNIVATVMRDMATDSTLGGTFLCEFKQGVQWNGSRKYKFRDDPWQDGLSFEEWCSPRQVAREYYGQKNRRSKIKVDDDILINIKDLLGHDKKI